MKSRPKIGEVGELAIPTDMKHAVEFAGDGMPAVVSTPHLVGFLERTARETIASISRRRPSARRFIAARR
jgi:hypothetical protein